MVLRLFISLILFCVGNAFILIAFQTPVPDGEKVPEWIYDLLYSGIALFSTAPFFLIWGLCKKFVNWHLSWSRIPAALGAYSTIFNAIKELTGLNNDYSTAQLIFFLVGMTITITFQYGYHKQHIGD